MIYISFKRLWFCTFLINILFNNNVYSTTCTRLNIEDTVWFERQLENKGWSHSRAPIETRIGKVRNQGSFGWCFAYTAADLITDHTQNIVSASDIALAYYENNIFARFNRKKEGGFVGSALRAASRGDICLESEMISDYKGFEHAMRNRCESPSINIEQVKVKGYVKPTDKSKMKITEKIDSLLSKGKILSIGYYTKRVFKGVGIYQEGFLSSSHASTLIGKYFDQKRNECRYLIRNSWGRISWDAENSNSRSGYFSMSVKEVERSAISINWLE